MGGIEREVNVLSFLAASERPCSVSEISEELNLAQSNIARLLWMLEELKCVVQYPDGTYSLRDEPANFGAVASHNVDLKKISQPYLFALNDITHETSGLYIREGLNDFCSDQLECNQMLRIVLPVGLKCPLWNGATGKAMLAYLEKSEVDAVINYLGRFGDIILASGKKLDLGKLLDEIDEVKQQGFAIASEERALGVVCAASPIIGRNNKVIGSICVTGPFSRFNEAAARECGQLVRHMAQNINLKLGSSYLL